jgi:uncharacterized cupredoxin-like copper-binding protein
VALLAGATNFGLAGCSDEGDDGTETVTAVMSEFELTLDRTAAPAGTVRFVAPNEGEDVHELVLLKTDLAPEALPLDDAGDVDEEGVGVEAIGEVEDVAPGDTGEFTVDVTAGKYVLICNISMLEGETVEHHYALGMRAAFTVE